MRVRSLIHRNVNTYTWVCLGLGRCPWHMLSPHADMSETNVYGHKTFPIPNTWSLLKEGRKEMFYLTMHSTHFIYGYMLKREETHCHHYMGYSFWLAAMGLLYTPPHKQDSAYHGLCYTSRGALAGTRNSSMGPPWRINPTTHRIMSEHSYHEATSHFPC